MPGQGRTHTHSITPAATLTLLASALPTQVAGLPPVTREWFESRRELLLASAAAAAKPTGVQVSS